MSKPPATAWRHLLAFLSLPGIVIFLVPGVVLVGSGGWRGLCGAASAAHLTLSAAGVVPIALGASLMAMAIRLFVRAGHGTLAPWDPPQNVVVRGVYRYVRNPMITGVALVLFGEAALFASWTLFGWFLAFTLANAFYIPLVEEPALVRRFGDPFCEYCLHVPRWIPRPTPWDPPPV